MKQSPLSAIPEISILGWMAYLWFLNVISFFSVPPVFVIPVATYLFQSTASGHFKSVLRLHEINQYEQRIMFSRTCFFIGCWNISLLNQINIYPRKLYFASVYFWKFGIPSLIKCCASSFPLAMIHATSLRH